VLISVSLCVQHVVRPASKEYPDAAEVKGCIAIPCKSYGEELLRHLLNIHRDGILVIFFHSHFATIQIYQIWNVMIVTKCISRQLWCAVW